MTNYVERLKASVAPPEGTPEGDLPPAPAATTGTTYSDRLRASVAPAEVSSETAEATVPLATGLARSAVQGATFNFGDEIEAGIAALFDVARGKGGFQERYDQHVAQIRADLSAFREERPALAFGAEMAGAVAVPGLGTAGAVGRGATAGSRIVRGLAAGAGVGGVAGAGAGEGGVAERMPGAVGGALVGAGVGAAIPAVGAGAAALGRGLTSTGRASHAVRRALARDGLTVEQARLRMADAAARGQPATLADVGGENTKQLLFRASAQPGEGRNLVTEFLEKRAKGQMERLSSSLKNYLGVTETTESAIKAAQRAQEAAAPFYERAYAETSIPKIVAERFAAQAKTPIGTRALNFMRRNVLGDVPAEQIDEILTTQPVRLLDAYKRGLDEVIGTAKRQGENALARSAQRMKQELLEELDAAVPAYASARKMWSDEASFLDAIDFGRSIFGQKQGVTSQNWISEFNKLNPGEKVGAMHGAMDALIAKAESVGEGTSIAEFLAKPGNQAKLMAVVPRGMREEWRALLATEREMAKTVQKVLRGSPTASRQIELGVHQGWITALKSLARDIWSTLPLVGGRVMEGIEARTAGQAAQQIVTGSVPAMSQLSGVGGGAAARSLTSGVTVPLAGRAAE